MRVLGIDMGERRIGLAISDETGLIAQGLTSLSCGNSQQTLTYLKKVIEEYKVDSIVVGLPLNINGTFGRKAQEVLEFVDRLKGNFDVPVVTWDERLTTVQGEKLLLEGDIGRKRRRALLDKLSAQIILQSYLDSRKDADSHR